MEELVYRRERTSSTPRMMTNESSLGAIIPVGVAEPLAPSRGNSRSPSTDAEKAQLKASKVDI